ncbi:MAG: hypothetical protein JO154_09215 [Chitinophaga sp.]|uniref:hypothetical protein n=1 Tax=Chitinophaga sp. TaxID=1869181 RepID=UPI0025BFCD8A|nr:hypothetical protein [Chitinophaga sp.]MBV8252772.1 hypothetical protein [Chitinophaga sp.]
MCGATFSPEIDQKINSTLSSIENTEKLVLGSDEHLDLILEIKDSLQEMSGHVVFILEDIESQFASITKEEAEHIIAKLFPLFGLAKKLVTVIMSAVVYESVKASLDQFVIDVEDLYEILNDLSRYKVRKDSDFSSYIS